MSEENLAILRAIVVRSDANQVQLANDDVAATALTERAAPFFDPGAVIRIGVGMGEATRTYVGLEGLREAFQDWCEPFEAYYIRELEALDCGTRVLRLTEHTARLRGSTSTLTLQAGEVWTFRDGRIVSLESYPGHAEARQAVGLER
jgi:hypothetical protein